MTREVAGRSRQVLIRKRVKVVSEPRGLLQLAGRSPDAFGRKREGFQQPARDRSLCFLFRG